ncbi:sterile alpha and TIR motif-containing protein 1-like isoform X2 [Acanthaster planci]|uniref:ADP-ribosyl cyclase/cyclic ADP-ribose hydrolase n=1 Tax=Acanthaster planci TaxID=133434 RepID=A0A8B7ZKB3_ACAPL|nr:sterile alpha and TIR motif-containing protein 1-like isoform X2 [Acanthaster planci]
MGNNSSKRRSHNKSSVPEQPLSSGRKRSLKPDLAASETEKFLNEDDTKPPHRVNEETKERLLNPPGLKGLSDAYMQKSGDGKGSRGSGYEMKAEHREEETSYVEISQVELSGERDEPRPERDRFRGSYRRSGKFKKIMSSLSPQEAATASGNEGKMESTILLANDVIQRMQGEDTERVVEATQQLYRMVDDAWSTPKYGRDLACSISDNLRTEGGLDILLKNCKSDDKALQVNSARLLEQVMTADNRDYVVKHGLDSVVKLACSRKEPTLLQIGMGLLENLFKHSEETCTKVIDRGGLTAVVYTCRMSDNITLRHCAAALANCAMYGGPANQQKMVDQRCSEWLFPLAFSTDHSIRYYACLAVAVLSANQDVEKCVVNSGTLDLVEPFVTTHDPLTFAKSDKAHSQGRSEQWLQRLMPLLDSTRREAQCLAAFHFAMEAAIKKEQGRTKVFQEILVVPALRRVASSNNEIASKLCIQALRTIGEDIPAKLSFNISCWTIKEVQMWVKNIGFAQFCPAFERHKVDGDLLLTISEEELIRDIEMESSLLKRRFLRELSRLKSNSNSGDRELGDWLKSLGPEYPQYTHNLVHCGIDFNLLPFITDEHLKTDAGITNGVHRMKILRTIRPRGDDKFPKVLSSPTHAVPIPAITTDQPDNRNNPKFLDVFISYRRATGSLLASLLKVHLQLRGFTVFIDVEKLEAGKFDNNLLKSVRHARNFVLVLSSGCLDRCFEDTDRKDWVHREIVAAIDSKCNIVPVLDNFKWPRPEQLPEDMRNIVFFNGVKWIHDYQDACIDKLERFLLGEENLGQLDLEHLAKEGRSLHVAKKTSRDAKDSTSSVS